MRHLGLGTEFERDPEVQCTLLTENGGSPVLVPTLRILLLQRYEEHESSCRSGKALKPAVRDCVCLVIVPRELGKLQGTGDQNWRSCIGCPIKPAQILRKA